MPRYSVHICCEGQCSDAYKLAQTEITRLRAAGYSPDEARGYLSNKLTATPHRYHNSVRDPVAATRVLLYVCRTCGHVRTYGAEEL